MHLSNGCFEFPFQTLTQQEPFEVSRLRIEEDVDRFQVGAPCLDVVDLRGARHNPKLN